MSAPAEGVAGVPVIEARPTERLLHGVRLVDDYAWLRADNWREVLRDPAALPAPIRIALDAENAYAASHLDDLAADRAVLLEEMRGRIAEDDASVPEQEGDWLYYRRYRAGGQLPLYCRRPAAAAEATGSTETEGAEEVLVDGDREREGQRFLSIGEVVPSPDGSLIAWSVDAAGSEYFEIRVRANGTDTGRAVPDTDGTIVWMGDGQGFCYVRVDENHRTGEVYRHRLDGSEDALVFAETDPAFFVGLSRTESGRYAVIRVSDHSSAECHLLDLTDAAAVPFAVEPRAPGLRTAVAHGDPLSPVLFIRTNADGAEDFKIVAAPVASPGGTACRTGAAG